MSSTQVYSQVISPERPDQRATQMRYQYVGLYWQVNSSHKLVIT
jgi:hypothetical protein